MSKILQGTTGFVEFKKDTAHKFMPVSEYYWLKEYTNLLYLWKYDHPNIIKMISGCFLYRYPVEDPEDSKKIHETSFATVR